MSKENGYRAKNQEITKLGKLNFGAKGLAGIMLLGLVGISGATGNVNSGGESSVTENFPLQMKQSPSGNLEKNTPEISPTAVNQEPKNRGVIYWVFAHADDETLTAAGAIKESQDSGYKNIVVIVSSGENTAVGDRLGLSKSQTAAAREKEVRAALSVLGVYDVRILGVPDGEVRVDFVKDFIEKLIAESQDSLVFRGHSSYDTYLDLPCGHSDHCAIGTALLELWHEGKISDLKLYRIGHLYGGPKEEICEPLDKSGYIAKQRMRAEYAKVDESQGRYGIGAQSVPKVWKSTEIQPECYDLPR